MSSINSNDISVATLQALLADYLLTQKQQRFWRRIKRGFIWIIVLLVIGSLWWGQIIDVHNGAKSHIGLIDIKGEIADNQAASAEHVVKGLARAYASTGLKSIILRIDSPGGSPVQADYIYNRLQFYKKKYKSVKIYAVCVDTCASAAYYVASAADVIYANPSSLVGSIGVVYNGFGFVQALEKLGISRRLHTAGRNKGFLDPFSPEDPTQASHLQQMLDNIHKNFIAAVQAGRGTKLKLDDDTFSGLIWTGTEAKARGLIDAYGSSGDVARDVIKLKKIVDYTDKQNILEQFSKNMSTSMLNKLPSAAIWHSLFS